MISPSTALAPVDQRQFFEKTLRFALERQILSPFRLEALLADGAKGIVQIANHFGTAHLRTDLEIARQRMVNLVSLYLEEMSGGDLQIAAGSLRDNSFLSHSKGGSDLLKRLQALPESTLIGGFSGGPEAQKNFLNEATYAAPLSVAEYRQEQAARLSNQRSISLACWLAGKMGVERAELESIPAEEVIRSALLVLFVKNAKLELPGQTGLVRLLQAARKKPGKLDQNRLAAFLAGEPEDYQRFVQEEMQRFASTIIPELRASSQSEDELLHGDKAGGYFINENIAENLGEYDRLVAREWVRITRGDGDDPAVIATIFLFLATGMNPKAAIMQREAKELIAAFRKSAFDSGKVLAFIDAHAPHELQNELKQSWLEDLKPEAEVHLADLDPEMPDSHMERALRYLRKTCNATWKGRESRF